MNCLIKFQRKQKVLRIFPVIAFSYFIFMAVAMGNQSVLAAKLADGTWSQSASPGTTTITFTNGATDLTSSSDIVLTFPSTASVNQDGTTATVTGQGTVVRTNNTIDNTITITIDGTIEDTLAVTITLADGLTSYTTSTYAQESVAINTLTITSDPVDFGVAIKTNDNTTTITASVPLFVNMAIDDTTIELGTLSTGSVSSATQIHTVNSNNQTGVTIQIATDGVLSDGLGNDINYVADGTVTAGAEEYGVAVTGSGGFTIDADYNTGDNDIIQAANNLATSAASVSNQTVTVVYKASIAGTTVSGEYDQVVTVTIATNA